MKEIIILTVTLLISNLNAQNLAFSNSNLKSYLINENCIDSNGDLIPDINADLNNDNEIQLSEALSINNLVISTNSDLYNISSIQDISNFSNLERLYIDGDFGLTEVSNLNLQNLTYININNNSTITDIDLSDLPNLSSILIEGLSSVQNLNLKNGSFASESFSLFYTYVDFACVDNIEEEYNIVTQHLNTQGAISIDCNLSTSEIYDFNDTRLYPNPIIDDELFINSKEKFKMIFIFNQQGKMVKEYNFENLINSTKIKFENISKGIYIINLIGETGKSILTKKIIID